MVTALALLLASVAAAKTCVVFDTSGKAAKRVECECPTPQSRVRGLPVMHHHTIWEQRVGKPNEYWARPWAVVDEDGELGYEGRSVGPRDEIRAWALRVDDEGQWWGLNPTAGEYEHLALAHAALGRRYWSNVYLALARAADPDSERLRSLRIAAPEDWNEIRVAAARQEFVNGNRAIERGLYEQAAPWLDASIAAAPSAEAYAARARLNHYYGREHEALRDADAGLKLTRDEGLRARLMDVREVARTAQSRVSAPVAPVLASPAPTPAPAPQTVQVISKPIQLGAPIISAEPEPAPSPYAARRPSEEYPAKAPPDLHVLPWLVGGLAAFGGILLGMKLAKDSKPAAAARSTEAATLIEGAPPSVTLLGGGALPDLPGYKMGRQIGAGGMGVVFEGLDRFGRKVAIKQMRREIRDQPREREKFLAEAKVAAVLSHPNVVSFQEVLEHRGEYFLVFEYVEGKPLSQVLHERKRLSVKETQAVFYDVCAAISRAHKAHVLHRDLKPSNIMIDAEGHAKVMDFGIARQAKDTVTHLTNVDCSGTPAYMAPEQHLGQCGKASDIFALGVCLYETLTGQLPFPGPDFLAQKERMRYNPPQFVVPTLPKLSEILFQVTLAADPARRVADAEELVESLQRLTPLV